MNSMIFKVLVALTLFFACCQARIIDNFNMTERFRDMDNYLSVTDIERDIAYNEKKRVLDVYYKLDEIDQNNLKPVVVYIHGGTWYEGDRIKFTKFGSLMKDNDFIAVLPEYILFPHGNMNDMVYDVNTAVQWTYRNIQRYGGDPNRITLAGHSAGAHLAALTLFKSYFSMENNKDNTFLEQLPRLEKVLLMAGIYDFDDFSLIKKYLGKDMEDSLVEKFVKLLFQAKNVSPYDILNTIPSESITDSFNVGKFIIYHTSEDELVPIASSEKIVSQIKRVCGANVDVQYVFKEGYTHDQIAGRIRVDDKEQQDIFISLLNL